MTIADTKKATTNTSPKTKHAAEPGEPSKPNTPKTVSVVHRPAAVQTSADAIRPMSDASTKAKKPTYEKRMRALAPVARLRRKLDANSKRIATIHGEVQRWANAPELRDAANAVTTALASMRAVATALPDDFRPERERKGSTRQLAIGTKVSLRAKLVERYADVISPEERGSLEVVSIGRAHVSVKTASGALVVLPPSHIVKAATA